MHLIISFIKSYAFICTCFKKKRINYNHLRILLAGESWLQGQKQKPENQKLKKQKYETKKKNNNSNSTDMTGLRLQP